jgi:hypothetical protein
MKWIPRFTETKSKSTFLFRTCGWGDIIITFRFGFLLSKRSELPSTTHGNDNVTQRTSLKERKDRNITYELYVTSNSRLKVGMRAVAARMRVCCLCTYRKTKHATDIYPIYAHHIVDTKTPHGYWGVRRRQGVHR